MFGMALLSLIESRIRSPKKLFAPVFMKQVSARATQAIGLTATLLGAASQKAGAASVDAPPGFFFSSLPFNDTGTTVGAVSDINAIKAGVSNYPTVDGPDVFYSFNVVTAGTMTFTVTPTGGTGYDTAIYLLQGAAVGANALIGKDAGVFNIAESFTTPSLTPGAYFFVVDSFYANGSAAQPNRMAGAYTLSVTGTAVLGAVPEPGTPVLAASALAAVGWRRRRNGAR
jgi:hypothetical protein